MKSFKNYFDTVNHLNWTRIENHPDKNINGKSLFEIGYIRYKITSDKLKKYIDGEVSILDAGIYPGITTQIVCEYFPTRKKIKTLLGIGFGLSDEFKKKFNEYNVDLVEGDLEKDELFEKIERNKFEVVLFNDVIEHLSEPLNCLLNINKVQKMGGYLILTTDNVSRFEMLKKILKGQSSNVPLIESSFFFDGDHRPHFREYSKDELYQLLKWSGYSVVEHEFYEYNFYKQKNKLKRYLKNFFLYLFKHTKNNHIIVAKKTKDFESAKSGSPTKVSTMEEWTKLRKKFG